MAKYKVVPVEITDEMAEASGCEGCFRKSAHDQAQDMWTAMLAAAPDVQGKPVAYAVFTDDGNIRIWCADPIQAETLRQQYGGALQPLYTATRPTQPSPDVSALVEALEEMVAAMHDYEMATDEEPPYKHRVMMRKADAALATYRNQGDEK